MTQQAGWHDDPTGRFGQRYYDGNRWTDHVVSARGEMVTDALPETDTSLPPPRPVAPAGPPAPAYAAAGPGQVPTHVPAGHQPGRPAYRFGWEGLTIGGVGLLMLALCLLVLPWTDADESGFLETSSRLREVGSDLVGDDLVYGYVAYGAFVLLVLTIAAVMLACLPMPPGLVGTVRVAGAGVVGLGAVLHGYLLHESHVGDYSPGAVPWLGLLGWVVAGVGIVIGARRASDRAVR